METLAGVTGIPMADQILMSDKIRLDSPKSLSAYNLPVRSSFQNLTARVHQILLMRRLKEYFSWTGKVGCHNTRDCAHTKEKQASARPTGHSMIMACCPYADALSLIQSLDSFGRGAVDTRPRMFSCTIRLISGQTDHCLSQKQGSLSSFEVNPSCKSCRDFSGYVWATRCQRLHECSQQGSR